MKALLVAVLSILLIGGCSKSDQKESASGGKSKPINSSRDLAKAFFAKVASGDKQAVLKMTLLGASDKELKQFFSAMGSTEDQGSRSIQEIKTEKAEFLSSGFDAFIAAMKKEGIDPAKVKLAKVDTSGIGKLPSADGGKGAVVGGELVLHFESGGRSIKAAVVVNCAKLKGGWVIVDEPEVSLTRGNRQTAGLGPAGSIPRNLAPPPGAFPRGAGPRQQPNGPGGSFPGGGSGPQLPGGLRPQVPGGFGPGPSGGGAESSTEYDDNWMTDLPAAIRLAKKENKHVFVDFTGSDWCPPCMALHRNVLTKQAFLDYAKKNLVLVVLDFPRRRAQPASLKRANEALSNKYRVEGFPTVMLMDGNGKILHRESGYSGDGAAAYVAKLKTKI